MGNKTTTTPAVKSKEEPTSIASNITDHFEKQGYKLSDVEILHEQIFHPDMISYTKSKVLKFAELYATQQQSIATGEKWVSVEDRLPENGQTVIALTEQDTIKFAVFTKRTFERWADVATGERTFVLSYSHVTHWQPLPQPPTKVKGE